MSEGVDTMFTQRQRQRHRLHFVEARIREVRAQQAGLVARAVDTMTSQVYRDELDPVAPRAVCEVMGQARQAVAVIDKYLDEWAVLRTLVT